MKAATSLETRALRERANRALVAKSIGELTYEGILAPERANPVASSGVERAAYEKSHENHEAYVLRLGSGVVYEFRAWRGVWDHLRVDPGSIARNDPGHRGDPGDQPLLAGRFFIDARAELEMDDIVLGNFLEEMHATLYSDVRILERADSMTADALANRGGNEIQSYLDGHPKILLNKGRIGFGASDLERFAPESRTPVRMHWVAVHRSVVSAEDRSSNASEETLGFDTLEEFRKALRAQDLDSDSFVFAPIHPWQWDRVVRLQFGDAIAEGKIVWFGEAGDRYLPQISVRTFSNVDRPERSDLKLPLTILNTSAIRGIPPRYIETAVETADAMARLCEVDPVLLERGVSVLRDRAGLTVRHPLYADVAGAPYRYRETLGAIWRQSVASRCRPDEIGVIAGSFFFADREGRSLVGAFARAAGVSLEEWIVAYFDHVVIPLYHLQLAHGLGLVAHGQNTVVRLRGGLPVGLFLKDFQGDLRASNESVSPAARHLDRLPSHYLIHDLATGHFVTVLRFVSETLWECDAFSETRFYALLADRLRSYLGERGIARVPEALDLLAPSMRRVLVNKVRFRIGYADSAARPLPLLGADLRNPLYDKPLRAEGTL